IQPSIICLCRYTVYCLSTGGTVRWQIRLEQVGTALMVYSVGKEAHSIRLCVATSSNTLLVFSDYKLMWNSQTEGTVISLKLSNFNSTYQNVLSMLSNEGKVSIGYLGTEPNLYKVPVDNRFIDFKAKIQELREIEASVKDTGNIGPEKKTSLVMKCTPGELEKATIEYETKQGAPICPLVITLQGTDGADTVKSSKPKIQHQLVFACMVTTSLQNPDGSPTTFERGGNRVGGAGSGRSTWCSAARKYSNALRVNTLGSRSKVQNKVIADRSREMRAIEALILSKTRNTKPETFEHIDLLYGDAHEQLFAAIDELTSIRAEMQDLHLTLASLFDLISMLLRLEGLETVLNGNFITDTNQTLEEHLAWASQIANDPSRAVAVLCQHQRKDLPQIKEEEEEEDDFDNIQTGEIKL
ncbi:hypothetical protein NECAME_03447, partial [Necator americanus]